MTSFVTLLASLLVSSVWADFGPLRNCELLPDQRVFLRGDWSLEDRHILLRALRVSAAKRPIVFESEREAKLIHEIAFAWSDEFGAEDLSHIRHDYFASYKKVRLYLKRGASVAELTQYLNANLPPRREIKTLNSSSSNWFTALKRNCAEALRI